MTKRASPDYPIHDLIADRWSPVSFADKPVAAEDLRSLFEAVRWAPSSYNAQPWRYIVASAADTGSFRIALDCLVEGNRVWARYAPVLAFAVYRERFEHNDKPNRAAQHDIGLASENLCIEATARGLHVHQMIGFEPDRVCAAYGVPEGFSPLTALAIGYAGTREELPEEVRKRDHAQRERNPIDTFVFARRWGEPPDFVG